MSKNQKNRHFGRKSFLSEIACTLRNPASLESGPELNLPFLFIWEWNGTFANRPDFWFTFPYHPKFEPILSRLAGFVSIPMCECNLSPLLVFWNGPERTSIKSHSWPCEGAYCIKFASGQLNNFMSA